jgi:DnaJ-class molecular chaperone
MFIPTDSGVEHMSEQAYEDWREAQGDETCSNCDEDGHTDGACPYCTQCGGEGGRRRLSGEWVTCPLCMGSGEYEVTEPIPGRQS